MIAVNDLTRLGVSPATARAFASATDPTSEHGQGGGSTQGPGPNTSQNAPGVGGPSPGARDNPTESYPNQPSVDVPVGPGSPGGTQGDPKLLSWEINLRNWGFTQAEIDQIYAVYSSYTDANAGAAAALATARGTATYARLFPGIQEGERLGLFSDEQGYRTYVGNLNETAQRFLGRNVTTQEVTDWLKQGRTAGQFEQHLTGQAYVTANKNDIQYALGNFGDNNAQGQAQQADAQGLSDYGDTVGGLNNLNGTMLQAKLDKARQRIQSVFSGTLASPSLAILNNGRTATTSGGAGRPSDIAS